MAEAPAPAPAPDRIALRLCRGARLQRQPRVEGFGDVLFGFGSKKWPCPTKPGGGRRWRSWPGLGTGCSRSASSPLTSRSTSSSCARLQRQPTVEGFGDVLFGMGTKKWSCPTKPGGTKGAKADHHRPHGALAGRVGGGAEGPDPVDDQGRGSKDLEMFCLGLGRKSGPAPQDGALPVRPRRFGAGAFNRSQPSLPCFPLRLQRPGAPSRRAAPSPWLQGRSCFVRQPHALPETQSVGKATTTGVEAARRALGPGGSQCAETKIIERGLQLLCPPPWPPWSPPASWGSHLRREGRSVGSKHAPCDAPCRFGDRIIE